MQPQKKQSSQAAQTMQPQPQQGNQTEQMTQQLATQLVTLLGDEKVQVKYGTMNAILQYTKLQQSKLLFLETDLFKLLVQCLKNEQLHKLALSTLIHFSSSDSCAQKIINFIQPIVMDLKNSTGLIQELGLLLLLNISKQQQFTSKILKQKEDEQKSQLSPALLQSIFEFMKTKPSRQWVVANIFVNISSHTIGRQYVAKQKLYVQFLKYINDPKQSLRLAVLRIIRNVCFLWQNEQVVTELLKKQHRIIDSLAMHILIMIIKSKLIEDTSLAIKILKQGNYNSILDYDMEIQPDLQKITTNKQKSINQIQICVDAIIILSNADFPKRQPQFMKDQLKQVISVVNFVPISEDSKDKLQALETFCFW